MKKVLFILRDYEHGGIPRVLSNLLGYIDKNDIDAYLFVCNPVGMFKGHMQNCTHLRSSFILQMLCCNYRKEKNCVIKMTAIIVKLIRFILQKTLRFDLLQFIEKRVANQLDGKFDITWACSDDVPAKITENIKWSKKILWIHNNYEKIFETFNPELIPNFQKFNKIICVSHCMKQIFQQTMQKKLGINLSMRTLALHNIVNQNEILGSSHAYPNEYQKKSGKFIIVSVGRLAYEKNFESIPKIVEALKNNAMHNFIWFIIGDGSPAMRKIIEKSIECHGVKNEVILLGQKNNPYPYIRYASLLVLTSRHEAFPTVINEAKALGTPVLTVPFEGVEEILEINDGWKCDIDSMAAQIQALFHGSIREQRITPFDFTEYNLQVKNSFHNIINSLS